MKRRFASLLLALALCLGLAIPAGAADQVITVGDETFEHLLQAMLSQGEDQPMTVTLGSDVTLTATVVVGSSDYDGMFPEAQTVASHDVTIDLNGHTLTGPAGAAALEVQAGYTLTIADSSEAKTGALASDAEEAVVVAEGGTYNALPEAPAEEEETAYTLEDGVASVTTMAGLTAAAAAEDVESILVDADLQVTEDVSTDKPLIVGEGVAFTIADGVKVVATAAMGGFGYEDLDSQDGENMVRLSDSGIQFLLSSGSDGVYRELYGSLSDAMAALSARTWTTVSLTGDVTLESDLAVASLNVFGSLTVAKGVSLTVSEGGHVTGNITLNGQEAPANLTCGGETVQAPANPFTDVPESAYYYAPVQWAVAQGITTGRTETTFAPGENCTRANIVTFLWRAAGSPEPTLTEQQYMDVADPGAYYYKAVQWAAEKDMEGSGTFRPNDPCTRLEAVYFLWRAADSPEMAGQLPFTDVPFGDGDENGQPLYWYADQAVLWAVENGVTTGKTETTFAPSEICTRGHIVTFLYRAANYQAAETAE